MRKLGGNRANEGTFLAWVRVGEQAAYNAMQGGGS
jgi:hypothetical protein